MRKNPQNPQQPAYKSAPLKASTGAGLRETEGFCGFFRTFSFPSFNFPLSFSNSLNLFKNYKRCTKPSKPARLTKNRLNTSSQGCGFVCGFLRVLRIFRPRYDDRA